MFPRSPLITFTAYNWSNFNKLRILLIHGIIFNPDTNLNGPGKSILIVCSFELVGADRQLFSAKKSELLLLAIIPAVEKNVWRS
jgi:hypothetical protein